MKVLIQWILIQLRADGGLNSTFVFIQRKKVIFFQDFEVLKRFQDVELF